MKLRYKVIIFFYVAFFAIFLARFFDSGNASTVADNIIDANKNVFSGNCYHEDDEDEWSEINPALTSIICYFKKKHFSDLVFFHSGFRPHGDTNSQHYIGNAVDFHFTSYDNMSYCEKILQYYLDWEIIDAELSPIKEFIGLGIYPQANNPFFHLDFGGGWRSWSRLGEYLSYSIGIQYMQNEIAICQ